MLGSLGLPEILFILVLALLVFGPKRLPQVGRTLGKALSEFRRATTDLKRTVNQELTVDLEDEDVATPQPPRSVSRSAIAPDMAEMDADEDESQADAESEPKPAPDSPAARTEIRSED